MSRKIVSDVLLQRNIDRGSQNIDAVLDPTLPQQAATKKYVDDRAPLKLHASIVWSQDTGSVVVHDSFNCSVVRDSTGLSTVTFGTSTLDTDYTAIYSASRKTSNNMTINENSLLQPRTTTTINFVGQNNNDSFNDLPYINLAIYTRD